MCVCVLGWYVNHSSRNTYDLHQKCLMKSEKIHLFQPGGCFQQVQHTSLFSVLPWLNPPISLASFRFSRRYHNQAPRGRVCFPVPSIEISAQFTVELWKKWSRGCLLWVNLSRNSRSVFSKKKCQNRLCSDAGVLLRVTIKKYIWIYFWDEWWGVRKIRRIFVAWRLSGTISLPRLLPPAAECLDLMNFRFAQGFTERSR